ncbi:hypothetical protein [Actinokineospora iranica]|uniref:Uncharacterized protein n=1 Tax=Actinokineospora iranica TaxID=1271860 RepID=A0A1G6PPQ3_9PSEU|nr:hypothetical protein [Actinokineospora iranica]SDC81357.1 hypothetical protein SAMN05216174_104380 [Actinokineospora iranica]
MRRRVTTFAAGLTLVIGGATACLLATSATATAASPIVVGDCSTTVKGAPGTPISLSSSAVLDPVLTVVKAVPLLGGTLSGGVRGAVSAMPAIPLGFVPSANSTISGAAVADAAAPRIKNAISGVALIGPVLNSVVTDVHGALAKTCGIAVTVVNTAVAPVQEAAAAVEQGAAALPLPGGGGDNTPDTPNTPGTPAPGQQPGANPGGGTEAPAPGANAVVRPDSPAAQALPKSSNPVVGGGLPAGGDLSLHRSDLSLGRAPLTDYSAIPFAQAGLFSPAEGLRYDGATSSYTPQFGILGGRDANGVLAAGHAEALDPVRGGKIALPVLLAVLALSGVAAGLVRTWVLRRTAA